MAAAPAEAAAHADIVFEVTADDDSSRAVRQGPHGILAGARSEAVPVSASVSVSQDVRAGRVRRPGKSSELRRLIVDTPRVATMNVDRTEPGPSFRSFLGAPAARTFGAIPPPALVLLGIVSVQVGSALAKHLFSEVGSFGTVALRLLFAAAVLMLWWRPSLRMNRRAWTVVLGYGVVLGSMNLCFYLALARIPLGIAVTIEFLGPLAVALAGSRRWLDAFWALLAAGGVVLLMEGRGDLDLAGLLFALAAGTCWGLYILVGAALGRHTSEGHGLALGMAVAALVAVPFGVADSKTALLQPWVLMAGLGVALLSSVIPYSLDLEALRRIPPRVFGILMSLEPAMAALIGLVVLQESLRRPQWIAVACVVAASAGAARGARPDIDQAA
nr:EamA family transporter [Streptomyces sp. Caat 7-52]